jgi:[ribosomal protein S5]-alanine N-acetyltransferase
MLDEFEPIEPLPNRIESKRLLLRQVRLTDAREIAELHTDAYAKHLRPWSPQAIPHENMAEAIADFENFTLLALERWEEDLDYRFAIVLKRTLYNSPSQGKEESKERIIGLIGVTNIIRGVSHAGFIGYWIGADHVNQGYATEATVLAMQFAFDMLRLHRVNLWIAEDNAPSLRIADKLCLRYEGTVIKALFLGGEWKDTRSFGIIVDEWRERREELMRFVSV